FDVSNRVMGIAPLLPAIRLFQNSGTEFPRGARAPRPVTTTLRGCVCFILLQVYFLYSAAMAALTKCPAKLQWRFFRRKKINEGPTVHPNPAGKGASGRL